MEDSRTGKIFLAALALFAVSPLFYTGYPWNPIHQNRILTNMEQTRVVIQQGQFPVRWFPDVCHGGGSPYPIYESPSVYILANTFRIFGLNSIGCLKSLAILLITLSIIGMYQLGNTLFGPWGGVLSSILDLYCPFRIAQLQVLGDLSAYAAGTVFPFALNAVIRALREKGSIYPIAIWFGLLTILDYSGLIALLVPLIIICVVVSGAGNPRKFFTLFLAVLLGLGIAATFWVPCVVEGSLIRRGCEDQAVMNPVDHLLYPGQWITHSLGSGISRPGLNDDAPFNLGLIQTVLVMAAMSGLYKTSKRAKQLHIAFIISFILILFFTSPLSGFLWENTRVLQSINYPWRLMWIAGAMAALLGGTFCRIVKDSQLKKYLPGTVIAISLVVLALEGGRYTHSGLGSTDMKLYSQVSIQQRGADRDWLGNYIPAGQKYPLHSNPIRLNLHSGDATVTRYILDLSHQIVIETEANIQSAFVTNIMPFHGWSLKVDGTIQERFATHSKSPIEFIIPSGTHRIGLIFLKTTVRRIADWISLISLCFILFMTFLQRVLRRHETGSLL